MTRPPPAAGSLSRSSPCSPCSRRRAERPRPRSSTPAPRALRCRTSRRWRRCASARTPPSAGASPCPCASRPCAAPRWWYSTAADGATPTSASSPPRRSPAGSRARSGWRCSTPTIVSCRRAAGFRMASRTCSGRRCGFAPTHRPSRSTPRASTRSAPRPAVTSPSSPPGCTGRAPPRSLPPSSACRASPTCLPSPAPPSIRPRGGAGRTCVGAGVRGRVVRAGDGPGRPLRARLARRVGGTDAPHAARSRRRGPPHPGRPARALRRRHRATACSTARGAGVRPRASRPLPGVTERSRLLAVPARRGVGSHRRVFVRSAALKDGRRALVRATVVRSVCTTNTSGDVTLQ